MMPYPEPKWWQQVPWVMIVTALAVVGFAGALVLFGARLAHAGGPAVVTWDQVADCVAVTSWELLAAPVTTANPNPLPGAATVAMTIPNTPPCGLAMSRTVTTSGVGPTKFWIRAVAGAFRSGESNSVEVALPLARPSGLGIALP